MPDRPDTATESKPIWEFWHWKLHWQIFAGLMLGAGIGYILGAVMLGRSTEKLAELGIEAQQVTDPEFKQEIEELRAQNGALLAYEMVVSNGAFLIFQLFGDLFLNGLKLVVVPLVTSSIVIAVAGLGARSGFGRLGLKTLVYYISTSLIAILIGLFLVNLVRPGVTASGENLLPNPEELQKAFSSEQASLESKVSGRTSTSFLDVFRKMIPANPVEAAAEGNLLGLIVVSMLIGFFMTRLSPNLLTHMTDFWQAIHDITFSIVDLVLRFAPLGVMMLMAATISENYARLSQEQRFDEFFWGIISFAGTTFVALLVHFLVVMPLILLFVARVNPVKQYKAMIPAMFTAFSTSSSNATLPVTMECVEKNVGVSEKTTSFVLPLGATVNMDGTALYECVAAIFIVQAFGVELSFGQQFFVVVVALMTSIGVAGVPSASLVAIVIILQSLSAQLRESGQIDIPLEAGLPILLVFDRLLDMCRTVVNIFSDSCGAVVVAKSEGESLDYPNEAG